MNTHTFEEAIKVELFSLVTQYRLYNLTLKEITASTTESYCGRLRFVFRAIGTNPVLADMTQSALQRVCLERAKNKPQSAGLYKFALLHFCEWLISQGWLNTNVARNLKVPSPSDSRREPIPDSIIEEMLAACDRLPKSESVRVMALALLSTLAFGALRKQEAQDLKVEDIRLGERCIKVWEGKGRQHRTVYPAPECITAMRDWLRIRPASCTHPYLFIANRFSRLGDFGLYNLIKQVKEVAGYRGMKLTPHQFRHSCASRLANNGMPLPAIQAMLGHASLKHTAIYIHVDHTQQAAYAHLGSLRPAPPPDPEPPQAKQCAPADGDQRRRFAVRRRTR